ncbi:peptidase U62 modulator of DNA gyrase [Gloeothece citriformis PCC 7424]|uniref:Peptidase U62 modulator of DNA gyrase n=1 Tax=Gloeothece citriformis (strain PCC 7424) TaxID=65393 RepID=B7K7M4_GLOC7|nr:TldD/PmbA family protein [Gloeothece citriformis]ACK69792.1 peptidase U62 modulator of DNA gyrase [Gloeothece citriformis PCC 7424]
MPKVEEIANYAQTSAQNIGIKKFDIYGSSVDDTSVEVFQGEPKQVEASNRSTVIVRVWNQDNLVGVTTTTDVDSLGIELALKTAYEASHFGVKDNIPDFSPEAKAKTPEIKSEPVSPAPAATLIEKLISAEKTLMDAHPAIVAVPYNGMSQQDVNRFYLNSEGALRQESRSYASIYLYTKTEQEGKKPRSAGSYKVSQSLDGLDIDGCLKEATEKTLSHLDYKPIKSGQYQVVFSPRAFLSLLGAFSNLYNAQNILDKQSLSTPDSLGKQIASSGLSVYDDALHPGNVSAETFDGEGTPTRRVPIIEKGILTGFLHSTGTAKRMNAQPTGNANLGAKVTVSPNYYHVVGEETSGESYSLETVENVVYIDNLQALHAGVNALQGSFSLPFDGWLVNHGELTSIDSATVAGDFLKVLQSIIFVESEAEITPRGVCPRVWIDKLSITGE